MAEPIINVVLSFDSAPEFSKVAELIAQLMQVERLGGVPTEKNGVWTIVPRQAPPSAGELERHLTVLNVDDTPSLWSKVSEITLGGLLKPDRIKEPWWEMVLLRNAKGPSSILLRVHHVIGDGIALVGLVRKILTQVDGSPVPDYFSQMGRSPSKGNAITAFLGTAVGALSAAVECLTLGMSKFDSDLAFSGKNKSAISYSGKRRILLFPDIDLDFVKVPPRHPLVCHDDPLVCPDDPLVCPPARHLLTTLPATIRR